MTDTTPNSAPEEPEITTLWERGEKLADICQSWLNGARARIEAARSDAETAQP